MVTEAVVRHALTNAMLAAMSTPSATVYEFWVPQTNERADVAIIGQTIEGFEIKTERDSLQRLPRQAEAYTRVFDRCHAVLAERHIEKALGILQPCWGVLAFDGELSFRVVREAAINDGVNAETLVRLLWRHEAHEALCALGDPPDPGALRGRLWDLLLMTLDLDGLKRVVRDALIRRDPRRARIPSRRFSAS